VLIFRLFFVVKKPSVLTGATLLFPTAQRQHLKNQQKLALGQQSILIKKLALREQHH